MAYIKRRKPLCVKCGVAHYNFATCGETKSPITSFRDLSGTGYHDWQDVPGPHNAGFGQPLPDMGSDIFTRKDRDG